MVGVHDNATGVGFEMWDLELATEVQKYSGIRVKTALLLQPVSSQPRFSLKRASSCIKLHSPCAQQRGRLQTLERPQESGGAIGLIQ